jgi:hypothetical protein
MRRDRGYDGSIFCAVTPEERDAVDALRAALGLFTDADLMRVALFNLSRQVELYLDPALFAVRAGRPRKVRAARADRPAVGSSDAHIDESDSVV